ncbi:unnamed protein product [Paramecium sonneborni]|uniref:Ankyrin repeat protein n=1 Tax=Paramecium sonneborni TaxID=65129 RepID=A0A8S1LLY5_9CILI|nr:unnamed protein product [Paramecium sonneborni]
MGKFEITYNIEPNYLPKKEKRVQIQKNNEQKSNPELIESIQDDKFIVFKDLIEKGASIYKILKEERQNVSSSFGIQKYARINYAEYLQNKNVDWECEDNDGMTPLFQAIKRESIKMIEYLLKQKVNLEHQDNQNRTPFYYACSFGQLFIIGFLLERGANINLEQLWEELHFQKQVFQDYIMWLNIYFNNLIQTIIMQINQEEMHYIMQYLILKVVEMEDKLGLPLIAQLLLEHRIDVESKDKDENTPLYEPASSEALSSIPILIAFGCDINSRNKFGETALIVAAKFNHYETAKLLIENQADFLLENEGFTAMEIAVKMINLKHFNIYQIK